MSHCNYSAMNASHLPFGMKPLNGIGFRLKLPIKHGATHGLSKKAAPTVRDAVWISTTGRWFPLAPGLDWEPGCKWEYP